MLSAPGFGVEGPGDIATALVVNDASESWRAIDLVTRRFRSSLTVGRKPSATAVYWCARDRGDARHDGTRLARSRRLRRRTAHKATPCWLSLGEGGPCLAVPAVALLADANGNPLRTRASSADLQHLPPTAPPRPRPPTAARAGSRRPAPSRRPGRSARRARCPRAATARLAESRPRAGARGRARSAGDRPPCPNAAGRRRARAARRRQARRVRKRSHRLIIAETLVVSVDELIEALPVPKSSGRSGGKRRSAEPSSTHSRTSSNS